MYTHNCSRFALLGMVTVGACQAPVAPAPNGSRKTHGALVVAESPVCSVVVDQISYDDPGADDAELIQLVVIEAASGGAGTDVAAGGAPLGDEPLGGAGGSSGGQPGSGVGGGSGAAAESLACGGTDAGTQAGGGGHAGSAGVPAPAETTLGDCGLESLDLLNGGVDGCPVYRSIDLTAVVVPEDGFVVVCSEDSTLAGEVGCDVTHAGTRKLPNGWIQNGPADALRFVGTDGTMTELGYEGTTSECLLSDAVTIHDETGEASDGSDDVNVACGDTFQLMSTLAAPLRTPGPCGSPGDFDEIPEAGVDGATRRSRDGGLAPGAGATYGSVTGETVTQTSEPLLPARDAGSDAAEIRALELVQEPPEVSCRVARPGHSQGSASTCLLGLSVISLLWLRRPRKTGAPRARRTGNDASTCSAL